MDDTVSYESVEEYHGNGNYYTDGISCSTPLFTRIMTDCPVFPRPEVFQRLANDALGPGAF